MHNIHKAELDAWTARLTEAEIVNFSLKLSYINKNLVNFCKKCKSKSGSNPVFR